LAAGFDAVAEAVVAGVDFSTMLVTA
jgi:hypothetical protein